MNSGSSTYLRPPSDVYFCHVNAVAVLLDVEAQVTVRKEAKVDGGVKWISWIFSEPEGKTGSGIARETVQTNRLKLTPEQDGKPIEIARERVQQICIIC